MNLATKYFNKLSLNQGFTLVELMVIMILITILSSAFLPNFLDISKRRSDLIISEMWTIAQAIQTYDAQEGSLPDSLNNCQNAISVLTNNNFIAGIATNTGGTPWAAEARYITECNGSTATLMTLSITTNEQWAPYIENGLPAAIRTGSTTILNISKLAYVPVLERFLYQDASITTTIVDGITVTSSPSGTYIAQGNIDMNHFSLYNASPSLGFDATTTTTTTTTTVTPSNNYLFESAWNSEMSGISVQTLSSLGFRTIDFNNPTTSITSGSGFYDAADDTYIVQESGLYLVFLSIRLPDNGSAAKFGIGSNIANADYPGFFWTNRPDLTPSDRAVFKDTRIVNLTAGDKLRAIIYFDAAGGNTITIISAAWTIYKIN